MDQNSPSITRLIASFLVIASVTTAIGFGLSWRTDERSRLSVNTADRENAARTPATAFVETTPPATPPSSEKGSAEEDEFSKNLTAKLLAGLADGFGKANPSPAPQNGVALPNTDDVLRDLAQNNTLQYPVPDWERELSRETIHVKTKYDESDIARYGEKVNDVLAAVNYGSEVLAAAGKETTSELAALSDARLLRETRRKLLALEVPEPLAGFHWSLVKVYGYQQKALEIVGTADNDPVRATVVYQAHEDNYFKALELLEHESQRVSEIHGFAFGAPPSFFASLFLPRTAHALFFSIVFDPTMLAKEIWKFGKMLLTEKTKNIMINRLVSQTIKWIQGGGKPQFITDWKGFLRKKADEAVGTALYDIEPGLCQPFADDIKRMLRPDDPTLNPGAGSLASIIDKGPVRCTLSEVVGNISDFPRDFSEGGWEAYTTLLDPNNNYYGNILLTRDALLQEAADEEEAAENAATAAGGYGDTELCVKWEKRPVGTGGLFENVCVQKEITTPGRVLAESLSSALSAPLHRIVNAKDVVGLLAALSNSLLDKLITLGRNRLNKGVSGVTFAAENTDACAGLSGEELQACRSDWQAVQCSPASRQVPVTINNVNISGSGDFTTGDPPTTGGGDFSGSGSGSGSFTQQGGNCTGGMTIPGNEGSKCGPNPPPGCSCTGDPGGPTSGDFTMAGLVNDAWAAAEAECLAGNGAAVGLTCANGTFTPTGEGDTYGLAYVTWVANWITANGGGATGFVGQLDEVWVRDAAGTRSEHYDITTSFGTLWRGDVAVCVPPHPNFP